MKTFTNCEKFGLPETLATRLVLFLLAASYVFATHSPANAQSSSAKPANSQEAEIVQKTEPKKSRTLRTSR